MPDDDDDDVLNDDTGLSVAGVADVTVATQFADVSEAGSTIPAAAICVSFHDNVTVPDDGINTAVVIVNVKLTPSKSELALVGGRRRGVLLLTGSIVSPSIY